MDLKNKINADFIAAMKAKDMTTKTTLGMIKSKITEFEKKNGTEASDTDVVMVMQSYVKMLNQTLAAAPNDHATHTELDLVASYLPKQMTEEEMREEVIDWLKDIIGPGNKSMLGAIMGYFKANFAGTYDAKLLKGIVEDCIEIKK